MLKYKKLVFKLLTLINVLSAPFLIIWINSRLLLRNANILIILIWTVRFGGILLFVEKDTGSRESEAAQEAAQAVGPAADPHYAE